MAFGLRGWGDLGRAFWVILACGWGLSLPRRGLARIRASILATENEEALRDRVTREFKPRNNVVQSINERRLPVLAFN